MQSLLLCAASCEWRGWARACMRLKYFLLLVRTTISRPSAVTLYTSGPYGRLRMRQQNSRGVSTRLKTGCENKNG